MSAFTPTQDVSSGVFVARSSSEFVDSTYDGLGGYYEGFGWRYDGFLDMFSASDDLTPGSFTGTAAGSTSPLGVSTPISTGTFTPHGA